MQRDVMRRVAIRCDATRRLHFVRFRCPLTHAGTTRALGIPRNSAPGTDPQSPGYRHPPAPGYHHPPGCTRRFGR
eukprot:1805846-Pyramimonas_sp.AAC.2